MKEDILPEEQLVPALYVRNLEESSAFYQRLGFQVTRRDGIFMELKWDRSLLFLVELLDQAAPPPSVIGNLRILVSDVNAFWQQAQAWGLKVIQPLADRTYGLREFTVAGPDGLHLRFASRLTDS